MHKVAHATNHKWRAVLLRHSPVVSQDNRTAWGPVNVTDSKGEWLRLLTQLPEPDLRNLRSWVRKRERPLTVFDLEATTKSPHFSHFGIIEVGLVHVSRTAEVTVGSDLINPEHSLSRDAARITGIRREQIDGQPTWAQVWARRFHWIAATHTTAGFNSIAFDCPAVVLQNERYGVRGTQLPSISTWRVSPGSVVQPSTTQQHELEWKCRENDIAHWQTQFSQLEFSTRSSSGSRTSSCSRRAIRRRGVIRSWRCFKRVSQLLMI